MKPTRCKNCRKILRADELSLSQRKKRVNDRRCPECAKQGEEEDAGREVTTNEERMEGRRRLENAQDDAAGKDGGWIA